LGKGERRKNSRLGLAIPVRVQGYTADGSTWEEFSTTDDVSLGGACFPLGHDVELGQILFITLALPKRLRQYDLQDSTYRVYTLVRTVRRRPDQHRVGVMYFGKYPPRGFHDRPGARYLLPSDSQEVTPEQLGLEDVPPGETPDAPPDAGPPGATPPPPSPPEETLDSPAAVDAPEPKTMPSMSPPMGTPGAEKRAALETPRPPVPDDTPTRPDVTPAPPPVPQAPPVTWGPDPDPEPRPGVPSAPAPQAPAVEFHPSREKSEERRSDPRAQIWVNFTIEQVDEFGAVLQEELTVADNVSHGGARMMTTLTFQKGDVILVQEAGGGFATRAEVRGITKVQPTTERLHLKFLDRKAPDRLLRQ
jgi:hypothetical protein